MKLFKILKNQKGFTLIELLVVIGILAVLLAITLIAINPARQFSQANNTKRRSDVNAILNAVNQYMADNKGTVPAGIPVAPAVAASISGAGANICDLLVSDYIAALPTDPKVNEGKSVEKADCTADRLVYDTDYTIVQVSNSRITVAVAVANQELGEAISVTR